MKRILSTLLVAVTLTGVLTVNVSAHHMSRTARSTRQTQYAVCEVEGCAEIGQHMHDGTTYCSSTHTNGGGHCGRGTVR